MKINQKSCPECFGQGGWLDQEGGKDIPVKCDKCDGTGRVDYEMPAMTRDGIDRYADDHVPTGGFLYAILTNNLKESINRADDGNLDALVEIVRYCYNEIPSECWGSPERVEAWLSPKAD